MKHRIISILVVLALVLTLVPVIAQATEEDTGFKASAELIEVIKQWEGFAKYPVCDYGQWSVGYGTRAPAEHLDRYRAEAMRMAVRISSARWAWAFRGISPRITGSIASSFISNLGSLPPSFSC